MKTPIKPTDSEKKTYGNEEEIERTGFKTDKTKSKQPETKEKPVPKPTRVNNPQRNAERHTPDATPGTD